MRDESRNLSRRGLIGLGAAAAAAPVLAACGSADGPGDSQGRKVSGGSDPEGAGPQQGGRPERLIGDGSTARTGKQPRQPKDPVPLEPGETPPQFVVFSWDGAGEVGNGLFPRFLKLAKDHDARMTFFLSGLYLLPESKKRLYSPPNNAVGASDIGYLTDGHIKETLTYVRKAWLDGHEIGTHFNGHFCAGTGSVANWTPEQWRSEIDQAVSFVTKWRTNTGFHDLPALPFDYGKELVGGRTPCLLGQENLLPTARELGWRYDASSPGGTQRWPRKRQGVWDFPLQAVPFPGHSFEPLSMDYNIMFNQSRNTTRAPAHNYPAWREQASGAYLAGFKRAYRTNRAPLFIGNHFEEWNGGIYMDAAEEALKGMAGRPDVRLVSFKQFTDWLDVQSPAVLAKLQGLDVGERPAGGWTSYTRQTKRHSGTGAGAST
ncbi:hypothetical protein [Streptomyces tsukubensis]|uniref:Lipoprotein n=1 Tax=Streptomyces tsukubensis TaxID=83656 RepID=A0A1V4A7P1_9ACTN|nr:hypothetical protein [Streptomyces tsukubensis]OON78484.1 hypothetical protein B1H18_16415 [Streptomyces tsukubensis]QFR95137.1 hypothetical protein GBW32_21575 [Streptomyces tsukubensis]